jgi:hypothetical protein
MLQVLGVVCEWYTQRKPLLAEGVTVLMRVLEACMHAEGQVRLMMMMMMMMMIGVIFHTWLYSI